MRIKKNKIYGFGINDYDGSITDENKKHLKSYSLWRCMISRCYNEKSLEKNSTYIGCYVCEEWKYYTNFKKWFDENYRYDLVDKGIKIDLDKDLLSIESKNKVYSPDTCVFLPQKVNKFIINPKHNNKSGYVGITYRQKENGWTGWEVNCREFITGKSIYLGTFDDVEDANRKYIKYKNIQILECKKFLKELGYSRKIINSIKLIEE